MSDSTKQRIIDSAELLFARNGFENTSLRMITQHAKVNLASVNYHFGSKKNLIQAVLARYLDVFVPLLDRQLADQTQSNHSAAFLVRCIMHSLLGVEQQYPNGLANFVQLLGRGYSETQGHLRKFILHHYGRTIESLYLDFRQAMPHVDAGELFWRLHFALGSLVFCISSYSALQDIAKSDYAQDSSVDFMLERLVQFVTVAIEQ